MFGLMQQPILGALVTTIGRGRVGVPKSN